MPEKRTVQSVAFGAPLRKQSLEAYRSSPYRFFLLSFLAFLLSCAALAFAFFTVSQVLDSKPSESYKNQFRKSQATF